MRKRLRVTKTMVSRSHAMSPIGTPHTPFYLFLFISIYSIYFIYHIPSIHSIPFISFIFHFIHIPQYSILYPYIFIYILHFIFLFSYFIHLLFYQFIYTLPILFTSPSSSSHQSPNIQLSSSTSSSQSLYFISHPSNSRRIIYRSSTFSFLQLAANSLPMRSFSFHFF